MAYITDDLSKSAKAKIARIRDEYPALSELSGFEGWGDQLKAGDWVLEFDVTNRSFQSIWSIPENFPSPPGLMLAVPQKSITLDSLGRLRIAKTHQLGIARAAHEFLADAAMSEDRKNAIIPLCSVVARLFSQR